MIPATPRRRQLKNNLAGIYGGMGGNPDKTIVTPVCNSELESPSTHRGSVDGMHADGIKSHVDAFPFFEKTLLTK